MYSQHSSQVPGSLPAACCLLPAACCLLPISLSPVKPPWESPRPSSAPATASPAGAAVQASCFSLYIPAQIKASCAECDYPLPPHAGFWHPSLVCHNRHYFFVHLKLFLFYDLPQCTIYPFDRFGDAKEHQHTLLTFCFIDLS